MYCRNFRFAAKKISWEFYTDSVICSKSSILHGLYITNGFCWIVLEFAKIWPMVRISSKFEIILLLLLEMFLLYISLIYLLIYRSYDAFNADDLDKTSRQKRQFEKVIIPILWEIHRTNVLQKLSLCSLRRYPESFILIPRFAQNRAFCMDYI